MSRATNDTISVHSSEPEKEAEDVNPVLRAAWECLQAKGLEYIEQLRREVIGQSVPDLPERLRRGPRIEASSSSAAASSSTVPKARPASGSGVRNVGLFSFRISTSNPMLRSPRPPAQPVSNKVQYRTPSRREINYFQLQSIEGK